MRASLLARAVVLAFVALGTASCIPSNVVARENRAVSTDSFEQEVPGKPWGAPTRESLPGFWRSIRVTGEVAASLAEISYAFGKSGSYSGAALSYGVDHPSFETLSGIWSLEADGLHLDGQAVRCRMREGLLEFAAEAGTVYLTRSELQ